MTHKVSIQGIRGSFHHIVAQKVLGTDLELTCRNKFADVFDDIANGEVDTAIVAIENSIAGSILTNYDLLLKYDLKIVGEYYLHIKMNLIALRDEYIEDIREVHSHPMAILQCREFLDRHKFKVVETDDTAGSAKTILDNNLHGVAAIAGDLAADIYNMKIIKNNIETNKENFTRFLIIKREDMTSTNDNKASIMVELKHKSGSLFKFLQVFDSLSISLSKIESRPIIGKPWEYRFYIDFNQNLHSNKGIVLLHTLQKQVLDLKILGSYPDGLSKAN